MKVETERPVVPPASDRAKTDDATNADLIAAFGVLLAQASATVLPTSATTPNPSADTAAVADAAPSASATEPDAAASVIDPEADTTSTNGAPSAEPVPGLQGTSAPTAGPDAPSAPTGLTISTTTAPTLMSTTAIPDAAVATDLATPEPAALTPDPNLTDVPSLDVPSDITDRSPNVPLDATGTGAESVPAAPVPGVKEARPRADGASELRVASTGAGATTASATPTAAPTASAGAATPGSPSSPAPPTPAAQLVSVLAPLRSRPDGTTKLTLALRPHDLGRVEVDLRIERGTVHLTLRAEQATTAELLHDAIDDLRGQLHERGITTGDLSVGQHAREREANQRRNPEVPHPSDDEGVPESMTDLPPTDVDALVDVRM